MRPRPLCVVAWLVQCSWLAHTHGDNRLIERAGSVPAPISVAPSQVWDGDDGAWSSFTIRVGTPAQAVRVFVSTAGQATWAVIPIGCVEGDNSCVNVRGGTYDFDMSSTWQPLGTFELVLERNLDITDPGQFGNDVVGLGLPGTGGPTLENQVVGGIATQKFLLGMFGVNPKPTIFSSVGDGQASYMTTLKNQSLIPSLSFGYTAGARYQLKGVLGSLTLGGYDVSRFVPNTLSFNLAPDNARDIVVGIQSITSTGNGGRTNNLLPEGILAYVDSTIPYIWLPMDACRAFEDAFGLTYDDASELYLVNDTLHSDLLAQDANITFTLGFTESGGQTVDIILPYASFDLEAKWPLYTNGSKYFPLKRADNDTQYTLGRTFLQEAYLIVDWERKNFSISQCLFNQNMQPQLVGISSTESPNGTSSDLSSSPAKSSNKKQTIGIAVGVVLVVLILIGGLALFLILQHRKKQKRRVRTETPSSPSPSEEEQAEQIHQDFPKAELNTDHDHARYELTGSEVPRHPNGHQTSHPDWVDEKARHPGQNGPASELIGDGVNIAELGDQRTTAQHRHEMYDPSATAFGLSANLLPELPGSPSHPAAAGPSSPTSPSIFPPATHFPLTQPTDHPSPLIQPSSSTHPEPLSSLAAVRQSRPPHTRMSSQVSDQSLPSQPSEMSAPSNRASVGQNDMSTPISPIGRMGSGRGMFSMLRGLVETTSSGGTTTTTTGGSGRDGEGKKRADSGRGDGRD